MRPYGSPGVPLVPALVRARAPGQRLKDSIADALHLTDGVTFGQLDGGWDRHRLPHSPAPNVAARRHLAEAMAPHLLALRHRLAFEGLGQDLPITAYWPLSPRIAKALSRPGFTDSDRLRSTTLDELLSLRNVGTTSIVELLCVAEQTTVDDLATAFRSMMLLLDERDVLVLRRRLLGGEILEDIGCDLGITRERVRQIGDAAIVRITPTWRIPPLGTLVDRMRRVLGTVVTPDAVSDVVLDLLLQPLGADDPSFGRVLALRMASYSPSQGLLMLPGVELDALASQLHASLGRGSILLDETAAHLLATAGIHPREHEGLVQHLLPSRRIEGGWISSHGAIADRLIAVLEQVGRPCTTEELLRRANLPNVARAARQHLYEHPGITRIDRDGRVALRRWGLPAYTSVADALAHLIVERGGYLRLDVAEVVIAERFGVAPSSVRAFAHVPRFVVLDVGMVRLRRADEPFRPTGRLARRWVFPTDRGMTVVRPVNGLLLRGNALKIPFEVAHALGVVVDGEAVFTTQVGPPVRVRMPESSLTALMSSLRPLAHALGAGEGDHLALRFGPEDGAVIATAVGPGASWEAWAAALLGDDDDPIGTLARPLGVKPTRGAVAAALHLRGDEALAATLG